MTPPVPDPHAPGIPPQPHCPCDGYAQYSVLRAQVVGLEAFPQVGTVRYELVVRELLGIEPQEPDQIQVSDHVGGYWNGQLGCGGRAELSKVGDDVLAFYRRGIQDRGLCCEYLACSAQCRGDSYKSCVSTCETTTQDACALHRDEAVLRGGLILIPWGDQFVVGSSPTASVSIAQSQIASLSKARDVCKSEVPDLFRMLQSAQPAPPPSPPPAAGSGAPTSSRAPAPAMPPSSTPTPPQPSMPGATPPPTPLPQATMTATGTASPPPAGPEEVRVRCAK